MDGLNDNQKAPEIKNETLEEIHNNVDQYFRNRDYSKNQYNEYLISQLSQKIVDLEKDRDDWKERAIKLQSNGG